MRVVLEVPFFGRFAACNQFLYIIISCYMARPESVKKPKLTGECRKCTEQDSPHARCIGSTILRRVSACNLFLHIIISCYMACSESIKKPKLTGECRKCTEQDSPHARCIGSTIFRRVSACNQFLHIIISWYMALFESIEMPKLAKKAENVQKRILRMLVVLEVPFFGGFLHATCSCTSLFPALKPDQKKRSCRPWAEHVHNKILLVFSVVGTILWGVSA
jgi:hypothetical protein